MRRAVEIDRRSISSKNKQRAEVVRLYTLLGHYVEATCNNDPATFNTSGFTAVIKTKTDWSPSMKFIVA